MSVDEVRRRIQEVDQNREPGVLGDLLSFAAFPTARPELIAIAEHALRNPLGLSPSVLTFAKAVLDNREPVLIKEAPEGDDARTQTRRLRRLLDDSPNNVPALMDLAQLQCAAGKRKAADRALVTAFALAPDNRTVLRTRARFLVHIGDAEQAHALVAGHQATKADPWLMATEIAVADLAGVPSRSATKARRMLAESGNASARTAELAAALGGLELDSGNVKAARALFRRALLTPNTNVIAQAVNDSRRLGLEVEEQVLSRSLLLAHEGREYSRQSENSTRQMQNFTLSVGTRRNRFRAGRLSCFLS